jgi:hypothetical protein
MKLSKNRTQLDDAPILFKEALFIVGRQLNDWKAPDISSNFTVHHKGDSITYQFEVKEVSRTPTYIEVDDGDQA